MKTALIIGITGNFGLHMAKALKENGWNVRALMRDGSKAPAFLMNSDVVEGSAQDHSALSKAAEGAELLVYAANPQYHRWHQEALAMLEPTVRLAEQKGLRILFPGNVYNFTPTQQRIDEHHAMVPPTDKGEIRIAMEARLQQATAKGAKVTLVRAGDFLGPDNHLSWLDYMLKGKNGRYSMAFAHDAQHVHYWTYLPDLCANTALLLDLPAADYEVYHDPGLALTQQDWQMAFEQAGATLSRRSFPWWFFKCMSAFSPVLREVFKMRYLWCDDLILDGSKLTAKLEGKAQQTSLKDIVETLVIQPAEKGVGAIA